MAKCERLPVMFRIDKSGEVTAVFPTQPGTNDSYTMACYAHIGQHGVCSLEWLRTTRNATWQEQSDLHKELTEIYTNRPTDDPETYGEAVILLYRSRISQKDHAARRSALGR